MMKHVEVHIEGFSHICDHCENKFKTRGSLQVHLSVSLSCKHAQSKIYSNTVIMEKNLWGRKELHKLLNIHLPLFMHCIASYRNSLFTWDLSNVGFRLSFIRNSFNISNVRQNEQFSSMLLSQSIAMVQIKQKTWKSWPSQKCFRQLVTIFNQ